MKSPELDLGIKYMEQKIKAKAMESALKKIGKMLKQKDGTPESESVFAMCQLIQKVVEDALGKDSTKDVEDDSIVIKLKILDPGDWSVGIRSIDDDMEIKLPKWILADDVKSEVEDICKFFQGFFDIQSVVTLEEYEADLKRQNDLYDKMEKEEAGYGKQKTSAERNR